MARADLIGDATDTASVGPLWRQSVRSLSLPTTKVDLKVRLGGFYKAHGGTPHAWGLRCFVRFQRSVERFANRRFTSVLLRQDRSTDRRDSP